MPYDVIVSGAGPAGCTCALFLANSGLRVLLLEKEKFPRDKVCADNKTWMCLDIVKELGLWEEFGKLEKHGILGTKIVSPSGHELYVPLPQNGLKEKGPWFNVRRKLFDAMLASACRKHKNILLRENCKVISPATDRGRVVGVNFINERGLNQREFARVVVGADGSASPIANALGQGTVIKGRYAVNARAYFENVRGPMDACEFHYLHGICPGYFWIFPIDEKTCNVGIGMRLEDIQRQGIKLEEKLLGIVQSERFRPRFEGAKKIGEIRHWGLSVLGEKRPCSGAGFVLCGDAGTFAMTFSGEGVGPAMRSGKIAALAIQKAFEKNDFSSKSLAGYDEALWKILRPEVEGMKSLEFLLFHESIFDFVVKKSSTKKDLIELSSHLQMDYSTAKEIVKPSTILKLLF